MPLHVPPLSADEVRSFLAEHTDAESSVADWATTLGQGSPGRALGFLPEGDDMGPLEQLRRRAFDIVMAATSPDVSAGYSAAICFPPAGARKLIDLFSFVEEWLRDLAAVAAGADHVVFNRDALSKLQQHVASGAIAPVDVTAGFSAVERAREFARGNVNPQLVVSGLVRELRQALLSGQTLTGVR